MNRLHLTVAGHAVNRFCPLLEKGVGLTVRTGCTLRDLLCGQIGISDEYLDQRIQTLFLDARPVDDVDKTIIYQGSTLALSSAMPGLLGATMRKGGRYAAFRESISQPAGGPDTSQQSGKITIKMFNMVAREVGPRLLTTGVEVEGKDLYRIVEQLPQNLSESIRAVRLNDQVSKADMPAFQSLSKTRLFFTVTVHNEQS